MSWAARFMVIASFCQRHPARSAFARCLGCGALVCQECATPVAGIMHCPACLLLRTSSQTTRARVPGLPLLVIIAGGWMLTHITPWALAIVAGWGR